MSGQEKRWRSDEDLPGVVFEDTGAPVDDSRLAAAKQRLQDVSSKVHEGEEKKPKHGSKRRSERVRLTGDREMAPYASKIDKIMFEALHAEGDHHNLALSLYDKYLESVTGKNAALSQREAWMVISTLVSVAAIAFLILLNQQGSLNVAMPDRMTTIFIEYMGAVLQTVGKQACIPILLMLVAGGGVIGDIACLSPIDEVGVGKIMADKSELQRKMTLLVNQILVSAGENKVSKREAVRLTNQYGRKYSAVLRRQAEMARDQAFIDDSRNRG